MKASFWFSILIFPFLLLVLTVISIFVSYVHISIGIAQENSGFVTPSLNIICSSFENKLRCDLHENTSQLPPRPKDCDLEWGNAFEMSLKGKPSRVCVGDAVPGGPILEYGKTWDYQGFHCSSEMTGLTCVNQNKKGWMLKKIEQRLF